MTSAASSDVAIPVRSLQAGVLTGFTSRHGGHSSAPYGELNLSYSVGEDSSAVDRNRELVLEVVGAPRLAWLRQVHGADVVYAGDLAPGETPEADAIFTDSPAVAVGVLVADCAPVLLADGVAGLAGAAHAGRPGMAAGVVPALVAAMTKAGGDPGRMTALIGPAI